MPVRDRRLGARRRVHDDVHGLGPNQYRVVGVPANAGTKAGNKGADAALCALELANLLRRLDV